MFASLRRPASPRRGVTLVEMLVVVALLVLMMTILVQIFQATTGTMQASRTIQELDLSLRLLDTTIRQDLQGATARFTPPLNPKENLGYFEYGEGAPADFQQEDGDDYLAFTSRTPEGQVFTGRQWLGPPANQAIQPTTITSNVAEVIYFLRNGNLYRRTFLVVPERKSSIISGLNTNRRDFNSSMFGSLRVVSWLGMNDISARPPGFLPEGGTSTTPIPNTLGDLTNRENRAFRPRFVDDFTTPDPRTANSRRDGLPDDNNFDNIPDYYPTLYYDGTTNNGTGLAFRPNGRVLNNPSLPFTVMGRESANAYEIYPFPYIYPGMYSVPADVNTSRGWIHQLFPTSAGRYNHSPLESGDSNLPTANQTWFGFPTWRETMTGTINATNFGWTDPNLSPNLNEGRQSLALRPFDPTTPPSPTDPRLLPPVTMTGTQTTPFGFDGAGSGSLAIPGVRPGEIWEDDLIMTNVRSFDVKAYDPDAPLYPRIDTSGFGTGYHDLGYAANSVTNTVRLVDGLAATNYASSNYLFQPWGEEPKGFGHEGRIPPKLNDYRANPTRSSLFQYDLRVNGTLGTASNYNVGDNAAGVIRLRRVFDTWSTDYTNAPQSDILLGGAAPAQPLYPSFPAPYPSPLRGIQIQIRVADPRGERVKVLTIRQDFTNKL